MADSEPEAGPKIVHVAPEADVILIASKPSCQFHVSSTFLKNASPVFRALLSGPFAEGHTLCSSGTVTVSVADEDDTATLGVLLDVLHLRYQAAPRVLPPEQFFQLAVLCDKYDCVSAVTLAADSWFRRAHRQYTDFSSRGFMAAAAAGLGMKDYFRALTAVLAYEHSTRFSELFDKENRMLDSRALRRLAVMVGLRPADDDSGAGESKMQREAAVQASA
ncbi:hypothetical protein ANO11243_083530 [Dothideomycetidae sp. 11243]|nr:hypothetical protein ANO11243_083530 [fungal sp. No.11243]